MPLENPSGLTNFVEVLLILLIPAALTYTFGVMVGSRGQGWSLFAAMMVLLVVGPRRRAALRAARLPGAAARPGVELSATADSSGGNMSDKEVRFGVADSALWGVATTAASNGSVNGGMDAWTGGAAVVPLVLIGMGEVVFGGVGSGMYGMLLYVLIAVFVAGLMVGRTPEYLGRKIEAREVKLAMVGLLVMPVGLLVMLSLAIVTQQGLASVFNAGPAGLRRGVLRLQLAVQQQRQRLRRLRGDGVLHHARRGGDADRPVHPDHRDHGDRRRPLHQADDAR